jgi:hypothetical protein
MLLNVFCSLLDEPLTSLTQLFELSLLIENSSFYLGESIRSPEQYDFDILSQSIIRHIRPSLAFLMYAA